MKKICSIASVILVVIAMQFVQIRNENDVAWEMSAAQAFDWSALITPFVPRTESDFLEEHRAMMRNLYQSAYYTVSAEITLGMALKMEPEKLQGGIMALKAIINSPNDMNAIRTGSQPLLQESELRTRAEALMSEGDKVRLAQLKEIMNMSATFRGAGRSHCNRASEHAAKIIAGAGLSVYKNRHGRNVAKNILRIIASAHEAQKINKLQSQHADNLKAITKDLEKRLDVKEPKGKEAEKLAKEMLKKR